MTLVAHDVMTVAGLIAGLKERLVLAEETRDRAQAAATDAAGTRRAAERQRDGLATAIALALRAPGLDQGVIDQLLGACLQAGVLDQVLREMAS